MSGVVARVVTAGGGVVMMESFPSSSGELEIDTEGDLAGDLPHPDTRLCLTGVTGVGGVVWIGMTVVRLSLLLLSVEVVLLLVRSCNWSCCFFKVFLLLLEEREKEDDEN